MTVETTAPRAVREIAPGTPVIYADTDSTYTYAGPNDDPQVVTIAFSYGQGGGGELRCPPEDVAPAAEVTVPERSDRVAAVKLERGHYLPYHGPWRLMVDGRSCGRTHERKRDAVATGLRVVAISDWHAA